MNKERITWWFGDLTEKQQRLLLENIEFNELRSSCCDAPFIVGVTSPIDTAETLHCLQCKNRDEKSEGIIALAQKARAKLRICRFSQYR